MAEHTIRQHKEQHVTVTYSSTNEKTLNEVIAALIIAHENKRGGVSA